MNDKIIKVIQEVHEQFKGGSGSGNFGHSGRPGKLGGSAGGSGMGGSSSMNPNAASNAALVKVQELKKLGWHNANYTGGGGGSNATVYASYRSPDVKRHVGVAADVDGNGKLSNIRVGTVDPTTKSGEVKNPVQLKKLPYPEEAVRKIGPDAQKFWFEG